MIDQEVQRRMDAYRGNPQALMQRYQQNQQLIDLLALQKIKSEKEAAAREMQMQMAQNQPGGLPTVAEQREKEVMDLTKQELAQQVGGTLQQQAQAKQAAMQKLMGGLTQAPGAGNAMQPQAMAAGGIVAFQAGGTPEDQLTMTDESPIDEKEREFGIRDLLRRLGARDAQLKRSIEEEFMRRRAQREGREVPPAAEPAREPARPGLAQVLEEAQPSPGLPNYFEQVRRSMPQPEAARPSPEDVMAQMAGGMRAARSAPPREERQAPPVGGLGDLARAAAPSVQMAPTTVEPSEFERQVRQGLLTQMGRDPEARAAALAKKYPGMRPEDREARERAIREAEARMTKEFDPSSQRLNSLIEFLAGGAGRSTLGSVGAGAARAASRYEAQQTAAQRERAKEIEGMREMLRKQGEDVERGRFTSELEGLRAFEPSARSALEGASRVLGSDISATAQREIAAEQRKFRELTAANASEDRLRAGYGNARDRLEKRVAEIREEARKAAEKDPRLQMLAFKDRSKMTADELAALRRYEDAAEIQIQALRARAAPLLRDYEKQLGYPSLDEAMPTRAAPVNTQGFNITGVRPSK
jgi:hypothetical protein